MGVYKDLIVYKKAYALAMEIFKCSKKFPGEEKYSLTSQIRRSSRSVCSNLAEAYKRRKYKSYFISKLIDCISENTETEVWMDFSKDCDYIDHQTYKEWYHANNEVASILNHMLNNPDKFL